MRGFIFHSRKIRLALVMLALAAFYFFSVYNPHYIKGFAEDKVEDFLGHRLSVDIGNISGGIVNDMTLRDVTFISGEGEKGKTFKIERMEISYRIWWGILEKLGLLSEKERSLKHIGVFF